MEIKKFYANSNIIILNGSFVKKVTVDELFELARELGNFEKNEHIIQIDAFIELHQLSKNLERKIKAIPNGETTEIYYGINAYRVTRLSKNFCKATVMKFEAIFSKDSTDVIKKQSKEEHKDESIKC